MCLSLFYFGPNSSSLKMVPPNSDIRQSGLIMVISIMSSLRPRSISQNEAEKMIDDDFCVLPHPFPLPPPKPVPPKNFNLKTNLILFIYIRVGTKPLLWGPP